MTEPAALPTDDRHRVYEDRNRAGPFVTDRNRPFWTGGSNGSLMIVRCQACGYHIHPPQPVCPVCHSFDVAAVAMSGRGFLYSFTICRYTWFEALPAPYVVAQVELVEQPGLILMSNLIECYEDDLEVGMSVEVCFAEHGGLFVPLFRPAL